MFLRPNSSFATEYIYMTTSFRNILPQVKFYTHLEWTSDIVRGRGLFRRRIEWPYREMIGIDFYFGPVDPLTILHIFSCASKPSSNIQVNEVVDRWRGGILPPSKSAWPDSSRSMRSGHSRLCPALDQVTEYIVLCDVPDKIVRLLIFPTQPSFVPAWLRADHGSF